MKKIFEVKGMGLVYLFELSYIVIIELDNYGLCKDDQYLSQREILILLKSF